MGTEWDEGYAAAQNDYADEMYYVQQDRRQALAELEEALAELEEARANPRDEYHTMEEVYEYRMLYNAMAANALPHMSVKSIRHSDGELCFNGEYFIVQMELPGVGQISNHYKLEHWDLFRIPEVELPAEYDGHTPKDAAERMYNYLRHESA